MSRREYHDYHINIFYSDEGTGATSPTSQTSRCCSAVGDTPREALAELLIAKELWLETAREDGKPIPVPRYRPAIYQAVAG